MGEVAQMVFWFQVFAPFLLIGGAALFTYLTLTFVYSVVCFNEKDNDETPE